MAKMTLINGIVSPDEFCLKQLLLEKGYEAYKRVRILIALNFSRIKLILGEISLIKGDQPDQCSLNNILGDVTLRILKPHHPVFFSES